MHTHPADLRERAEGFDALLAKPHVTCVDIGHTRCNELADDGATIFMAIRSTGQIEEGPPGFSLSVVDGREVNWRFKEVEPAATVGAWPERGILDTRLGPNRQGRQW